MDQTNSGSSTATTTSTIMAALSSLTQPELTDLTRSLSADFLRQRRRLSAVLSSPTLFSLTLHRLRLLSLPAKTALLAKHLLSSLRRLTPPNHHPSAATELRPRDLDAALLLLLLCDARHRNPERLLRAPPLLWRKILVEVYVDDMLTSCTSGMGSSILIPYIEAVARCLRFVMTMMGADHATTGHGGSYYKTAAAAAAVAAVVALPSVEARGGGECVICREEMREGRDVCRLPCDHLFHWKCVLPWLRNTNTCPCCRFQLPTDDVIGEIRRLWDVLLRMGGAGKESPPIDQSHVAQS